MVYFGFAINTMFAPTLIAPANNSFNQMPNTFLNWSAVPGAFTYKIQVSADSLFIASKQYCTNLTAIYSSELHFNTKYFWRVKAVGMSDSSVWSESGFFHTIATVTLLKPIDSSTNRPVSAYIKWNTFSGITGYEYQLDTSLSFSSPLFVTSIVPPTKTEVYSKQLAFGEHYYLRMRVRHNEDTSEWSEIKNIWTLTDLNIIKPQDDTIKQFPVTKLEWDWVGSKNYEYLISTDSLFTSPVIYIVDTTKVIKTSIDTLVRVYTDTLFFKQKYFWKVRAMNALDTSNWSPIRKFTTFDKMTIVSPVNGAIDVITFPVFTWDPVANISHYILEIDEDSLFSSPQDTLLPNIGNSFEINVIPLKNSTTYFWRMQAITYVDSSDWSSTFKFKTIAPASIESSSIDNNTVYIYPNPSLNGIINIQFNTTNDKKTIISIINLIGQEIYNRPYEVKIGNPILTIDLKDNENGIYFLKIQNNNSSLTRKIILNK